MKFICVVILALAVSAQAGLIPTVDVATSWGTHAWGPALVNHWNAPLVNPWAAHLGYPGVLGAHGLVGPTLAHHGALVGPSLAAGPVVGIHGHGPVVGVHGHGPVVGVHGHDGQYVAANRGSVHVAPLVGHVQSVSSSNIDPAPGTTW